MVACLVEMVFLSGVLDTSFFSAVGQPCESLILRTFVEELL